MIEVPHVVHLEEIIEVLLEMSPETEKGVVEGGRPQEEDLLRLIEIVTGRERGRERKIRGEGMGQDMYRILTDLTQC